MDTREKLLDIREKLGGRRLVEAKPLVSGAYLMPPASMSHLAGDVIEPIHLEKLKADCQTEYLEEFK